MITRRWATLCQRQSDLVRVFSSLPSCLCCLKAAEFLVAAAHARMLILPLVLVRVWTLDFGVQNGIGATRYTRLMMILAGLALAVSFIAVYERKIRK
jgi:hypothetical protein